MTETFRPPRAVRAETDLPATLTAADVAALRDAGGETGAWARRIAAGLELRAAHMKEAVVTTTQTRAEGADVPLADALVEVLGDTFELYAAAHRAHWNVTGVGPDFAAFHALFGDIYADEWEAVDGIAENLRRLGSLAPSLCVMPEESTETSAVGLAAMLLSEAEELAALCGRVAGIAAAVGQQGIANFLADRQDANAKWAWQLRSSLGIAEVGESPAPDAIAADEAVEDEAGEYAADVDVEARRSLIDAAEKRSIPAELRAETGADGKVTIRGYAAVFGQPATGLPFKEEIVRGAFARSLDRGDDCFLLVNHNSDELPLARRSSGTLTLAEDDHGLHMEAVLDPSNPRAAEVISVLSRSDVSEMSFAFRVAEGGSRKREDGTRELTDVDLFEVSICTWGAYNQTTVGLRSADDDLPLRWKRAALRLRQQSL